MARYADPYEVTNDPYQYAPRVNSTRAPGAATNYVSPGVPVEDPLQAAITDSYAPPAVDTSGWNTGKYAAPGFTAKATDYAMPGWEQVNWTDANMQTPKYAVGRILSQYPATPGGLQKAMADIQRAYPGTQLVGLDKLKIPGVGLIDVGQSFSDTQGDQATQWWWGALQDENGVPYEQGTGTGTTPTGGLGTTAGGYGGEMQDAIKAKLLEFINQDPSNVSITDPDLAPAAQTHDKALQRARRMAQSQLAEQASADGTLGAGGFDADVQKTFSDYGDQQAGYEATLVNEKMQQRRTQIMQALQLGGGLLDNEMERALRAELAQIDDATRRLALQQSNNQFYDNLGFNQSSFEAQMNQNLINTLLSGWGL